MKKIIKLGSVAMIAMPLVTIVSCNDKPIIGDNADYVEPAAKGKKPWKSIVVDLTGITTKSELEPKFKEALKKVDPKKDIGKVVFVKFIKPDGKVWIAKFIVAQNMDNSPMAKEYRKIEATLFDYIEPAAKGKKPWKSIVVDLTGITTKSELDPKFKEAFEKVGPQKNIGKIVSVKFIKPDGKVWTAKFIVAQKMDDSPMGKEYRKIEKTLKDDKKPSEQTN